MISIIVLMCISFTLVFTLFLLLVVCILYHGEFVFMFNILFILNDLMIVIGEKQTINDTTV